MFRKFKLRNNRKNNIFSLSFLLHRNIQFLIIFIFVFKIKDAAASEGCEAEKNV